MPAVPWLTAMPALALTRIGIASMTSGSVRRSRIRWVIARSSSPAASVMSSANSSPPSRARRSCCPARAASRCAVARSSSSPAGWPSVSLISLKLSRSIRINASRSLRPASCRRWSPCSKSDRRFPSPVSSSVTAWRRASESRWTCRTPTKVQRDGEQEREGRQRDDDHRELIERRDDEDDDRRQRGQHRHGQDRRRAAGVDRPWAFGTPDRKRHDHERDRPQCVEDGPDDVGVIDEPQGVDDVGGAEDHQPGDQPSPERPAARAAHGEQSADHRHQQ